jgi:hypothetical protein
LPTTAEAAFYSGLASRARRPERDLCLGVLLSVDSPE